MKRFAAMLAVSVLMVLWIASGDRMSSGQRTDGLYYEVTGIHPDAVLMRINGEDISAEEYLYWLAYDCEYLTSYVPNLDFSAEVSNGMTYGSYAKADAVETVKLYALLRQWAKQYNVSLTEEYNQGLYDKLDAGDFYSRLTARQSELSSQFSSGSADPGTDSGTGSSTDSDNSGEKEGGSTGSGD